MKPVSSDESSKEDVLRDPDNLYTLLEEGDVKVLLYWSYGKDGKSKFRVPLAKADVKYLASVWS